MEAEGNRACVQVFVGPVGRISIKIRSVNVAVQSARTPFFSSSSSAFDDTHMKQGKNKKKKGKNVEWAHPPASVRTDPKAISKERKNFTPRDPLVVRWGNAASSSSKKKKTKTDRQKNWETPDYDTYSSFFSIAGGPLHPLFFNDTVTSQLEQMEEEKKGQPFERTYPPTHLLARVTKHQGVCVCSFAHEPPVESRKLC